MVEHGKLRRLGSERRSPFTGAINNVVVALQEPRIRFELLVALLEGMKGGGGSRLTAQSHYTAIF